MEDKTALNEVIKFNCLFVCSVKLSNEQGVDSWAEIVTERRESVLKLLVVDAARLITVKLFEAVLPVHYVPIQRTKLIECYLSTLVSVKHAYHHVDRCHVEFSPISINQSRLQLLGCDCSRLVCINPSMSRVPWYGFSINKFNLSVRLPIKICPQFVVRRHVWWWRRGTLWLVSRHCSNLFYISLLLENVNVFLLRLWVKRHK